MLKNFLTYPSIKKIKQDFSVRTKFSFKPITMGALRKVIKNIPTDKAVMDEILINILKQQILPIPH